MKKKRVSPPATKDDLLVFPTKEDLKQELKRFATKDDLQTVKSDIMNHMDGFIGLHQKFGYRIDGPSFKIRTVGIIYSAIGKTHSV